MWNELGTVHSPARPFLRQSVESNENTIKAMCQRQLQEVAKGKSAREALNAIGVMQKGLIQNQIRNGDYEPNAPITIEGGWMTRNGKSFYVKGKKSSKPLIDSGRMRQSVTFVIGEKGGE
jgi:phage gpG-like protein